ncbi:MAG: hypothetical protein ACYTHM_08180 [Planctomycetota bacterium]|jgi:hypothetical protein
MTRTLLPGIPILLAMILLGCPQGMGSMGGSIGVINQYGDPTEEDAAFYGKAFEDFCAYLPRKGFASSSPPEGKTPEGGTVRWFKGRYQGSREFHIRVTRHTGKREGLEVDMEYRFNGDPNILSKSHDAIQAFSERLRRWWARYMKEKGRD